MSAHTYLKRRVVVFKGRRYVIHDSFIRWRDLVSVTVGPMVAVARPTGDYGRVV